MANGTINNLMPDLAGAAQSDGTLVWSGALAGSTVTLVDFHTLDKAFSHHAFRLTNTDGTIKVYWGLGGKVVTTIRKPGDEALYELVGTTGAGDGSRKIYKVYVAEDTKTCFFPHGHLIYFYDASAPYTQHATATCMGYGLDESEDELGRYLLVREESGDITNLANGDGVGGAYAYGVGTPATNANELAAGASVLLNPVGNRPTLFLYSASGTPTATIRREI